jgi:hypothetical protein
VPVDLQRILEAAVKAAVEPPVQAAPVPRKAKKRRLSTGRAMLLGAGLATAGRLVVNHKGRDILERVQQRIADPVGLDRDPEEAVDYEDEVSEPEFDEAGDDELADEDEDVLDDSTDEDQDPGDAEDEDADDGLEAAPQGPPARKRRQRRPA